MLENYHPQHTISQELFKTEMKNLHLYGYGIKGLLLCMIETANRVSDRTVSLNVIDKIIEIGHDLLQKPIELLQGVQETLETLNGDCNQRRFIRPRKKIEKFRIGTLLPSHRNYEREEK